MKHADLNFNLGSVNPSGIGTTVYRIRKRYISAWPTIENDPDKDNTIEEADLATYEGSFTLVEGKYWQKIYSTQGKGSITPEVIGEDDCKMFNNKGVFSYPDLSPTALGFTKASVNDDFVYIVKAAGRYHVIGSEDYRSKTTTSGPGSGDAAGSAKGLNFEIECPDVTPLPVYVGNIVMEDGTLNCNTGAFTPATPAEVVNDGQI
jgi:hypothetical protein